MVVSSKCLIEPLEEEDPCPITFSPVPVPISDIHEDEDEPKSNAGLELNGTMCDYEIICEDKKFSCHKAVLASNSKVFEVFIYL